MGYRDIEIDEYSIGDDITVFVSASVKYTHSIRGNYRYDATCPEEYHGCGAEIEDIKDVVFVDEDGNERSATDDECSALIDWLYANDYPSKWEDADKFDAAGEEFEFRRGYDGDY